MINYGKVVRALHDEIFIGSFENQLIITAATVFNNVAFPLLATELISFVHGRKLADAVSKDAPGN